MNRLVGWSASIAARTGQPNDHTNDGARKLLSLRERAAEGDYLNIRVDDLRGAEVVALLHDHDG